MAQWFETFFAGLYKDVLANQIDEARTLEQAEDTVRLEVRRALRRLQRTRMFVGVGTRGLLVFWMAKLPHANVG